MHAESYGPTSPTDQVLVGCSPCWPVLFVLSDGLGWAGRLKSFRRHASRPAHRRDPFGPQGHPARRTCPGRVADFSSGFCSLRSGNAPETSPRTARASGRGRAALVSGPFRFEYDRSLDARARTAQTHTVRLAKPCWEKSLGGGGNAA